MVEPVLTPRLGVAAGEGSGLWGDGDQDPGGVSDTLTTHPHGLTSAAGSGTRAHTGAFHHLLEMPQLGESGTLMHKFPSTAASAAPPAAPKWDHGRRFPRLTRFSAPWSGVTFRVPSLGPVFIPGLVQAASLGHADVWFRAKPCTSKRSRHKQVSLPALGELLDFQRVSHGNLFYIFLNFMPLDSNSRAFHVD